MNIKIGIDEAGRGPYLGPVVACSFAFNPKHKNLPDFVNKLDDSKKLTQKSREQLFDNIIKYSLGNDPLIFFGVGIVDNYFIDEVNIKNANKEAMRRSLIEIKRKISDFKIDSVVIDGNDNYLFEELSKKPIYIVGGDTKVREISGASIIAKVFRDKLIDTYAILYPDMGLEKHKGYGTKAHSLYLKDKSKVNGLYRISYKPIKQVLEKKPTLLLHVCCGPDATIPILDLKDNYDITCFWYDPNIQPKKEYDKRFEAFKKVCDIENIKYIKGDYEVKKFMQIIKGLEHTPEKGEKCDKCYDMRLEKTAKLRKEKNFDFFSTTLTISPHKDLNKLFLIGEYLQKKYNTQFLKIDFKKNNGFKRSIDYTKLHNIYRQNYCGCIFSLKKD